MIAKNWDLPSGVVIQSLKIKKTCLFNALIPILPELKLNPVHQLHQVRALSFHEGLLRKADIYEEKLSQMSKQHAVYCAWLGPMKVLLCPQPGGKSCQVLERHFPDIRVLMSSYPMQVGAEPCHKWLNSSPDLDCFCTYMLGTYILGTF